MNAVDSRAQETRPFWDKWHRLRHSTTATRNKRSLAIFHNAMYAPLRLSSLPAESLSLLLSLSLPLSRSFS